MSKFGSALLCATTLILASQSASALNMRFLDYSPTSKFTDEDWKLGRKAARKALDEGEDGQAHDWTNPDTGHRGVLTPLSRTQQDGMNCRQLRIENFAGDLQGSSTYLFCQTKDGTWKAASQSKAD